MHETFPIHPFSMEEMWNSFHGSHSTSKHFLTLYALAVGSNAQMILDIGIGATTQVLRLAARKTGGRVLSCDGDRKRFTHLLDQQDDHWSLFLGPSEEFLQTVAGPVEFAMHDGAHDYHQVKLDLELLLPKMRTFGLICVHDTQQVDVGRDLLAGISDATTGWKISWTNLPFSAGLAILRVEHGRHPPVMAGNYLPDGRFDTAPVAFPTPVADRPSLGEVDTLRGRVRRRVRRRLRRTVKGF